MRIGKGIEVHGKRLISSVLSRIIPRPGPDSLPPVRKVLFMRYDRLGDMILSIPAIRAVRERHPNAQVDMLASRKNGILLEGTGLVDNIIFHHGNAIHSFGLIRLLRKTGYDYIINLVPRPSFSLGVFARYAGPNSVRIAGEQEKFDYFYNWLPDFPPKLFTHMLKWHALLVSPLLNGEEPSLAKPWMTYPGEITTQALQVIQRLMKLDTPPPENNRAPLAIVNLSAGEPHRVWPLEKYEHFLHEILSRCADAFERWVVMCDPAQPHLAEELIKMVDHPSLVPFPIQKDFRVIIEIIRHTSLLISPDTSISHAATATGTPTVNLIMGRNPKTWGSVDVPNRMAVAPDPNSIANLKVEDVVTAFEELMAELNRVNPVPDSSNPLP